MYALDLCTFAIADFAIKLFWGLQRMVRQLHLLSMCFVDDWI